MKKYNNGRWTEARFKSFIKNGLRNLSKRWPPKYETLKKARTERGVYLCAGYQRVAHKVRYKDGVNVDHIDPVIDPKKGFTTWDSVIKRLFVESDKLQVLCADCHKKKTNDERQIANAEH